MRIKIICSLLIVSSILTSALADPIISLGFQDLPSAQADLPSNYEGLNWDPNFDYFLDTQMTGGDSGPKRITYGSWIDFGTNVTFLGSWVGTFAWGGDKYWRGYDDGELVYESSRFIEGTVQTGRIDVYWENVDYVEVVGDWGSFSIDDIRYTNVVPEPTTVSLISIVGIGLYIRKKTRR